jgi:hypothetical protein
MGLNRPALDVKGGYTFLRMETGTELSAAAGVTFNLRNTATDYQTGTEFHLEAALNQHFPFGNCPATPGQVPRLGHLGGKSRRAIARLHVQG